MDGSNLHLTRFDEVAKDPAYAGCIETKEQQMASSHQVKRFFGAFSFVHQFLLRSCLQKLFIWRLKIEKPDRIVLDVDTMVMNPPLEDLAPVKASMSPIKRSKDSNPYSSSGMVTSSTRSFVAAVNTAITVIQLPRQSLNWSTLFEPITVKMSLSF